MFTIRYAQETGEVKMVSALDAPRAGDLTVAALPDEPPAERGYVHELRVVDGALVWARVPVAAPEPEAPSAPTREEIEATRAAAYRDRVDPITCEIARLRDMGGSAEEIAEAEARREAAVAAIEAQYPYPEEE